MNQKIAPYLFTLFLSSLFTIACNTKQMETNQNNHITAKDILGSPNYNAICYGGYREKSRDIEPTMEQIVEDLKILSAMNIKLLRTYNVHRQEIINLLRAIRTLKKQDPKFEMYIMLGAWIDCEAARTSWVNHQKESPANEIEVKHAATLAAEYPDIIKIIAVGNEAMVKWATTYYVEPYIILKWVNYLQQLKKEGKIPADTWITSSDNFASWGGGGVEYHNEDLNALIAAVDYISMHTYPMHDTHYNPEFWRTKAFESGLTDMEKVDSAMHRAINYAKAQYRDVKEYVNRLGIKKPIHIGETGWASTSNDLYGPKGSRANDEYKAAVYYQKTIEWTKKEGLTCFYFEAFDEQWKDAHHAQGSENHFGLFTLNGQAKYAIWSLVDQGAFEGLSRNGSKVAKTHDGDLEQVMKQVKTPPLDVELMHR